jgi:glycine/D-amino acid oxidase-like deaminating enzyme
VVSNIIIIGGGIVGASFAYHANLKKIEKISIISDSLPGDAKQATSNTWGWINGYANNDLEYASLRLASLNYWQELIKNQIIPCTSKGAFFGILKKLN